MNRPNRPPLHGLKRRLVHALSFELLALAMVVPALVLVFNTGGGHAIGLAVSLSLIAMFWNMAYNAGYEAWERRQASQIRTPKRRILHALGFEGGLVVLTLPLVAWSLNITLWAALLTDIGIMLFFVAYAYAFNLGFDKLFGTPAEVAAQLARAEAQAEASAC